MIGDTTAVFTLASAPYFTPSPRVAPLRFPTPMPSATAVEHARRLSQRLHERVLVGVRSDPEPCDRVILDSTKGPPADPDSDGPYAD